MAAVMVSEPVEFDAVEVDALKPYAMQCDVVETDAVDSGAVQLDVVEFDIVELEAVVLYVLEREGVESGVCYREAQCCVRSLMQRSLIPWNPM